MVVKLFTLLKFWMNLIMFWREFIKFSVRLLIFVLISLTKLELIFLSSSLLIFSYWLLVKTILKLIDICKSKNVLIINLKMAEARNDAYSTAFIQRMAKKKKGSSKIITYFIIINSHHKWNKTMFRWSIHIS